MIVRQTHDNKIRCINIGEEAEDVFLKRNPTGGFLKVASLPDSEFYNWKIEKGVIVADAGSNALDLQKKINVISRQYLKDTDWYEIRAISGKPVPEDILTKRQEARDSIVESN